MIKTEGFDEKMKEMARFSRAISHPARLAILQYLAETRTCISGNISGMLPLSRSTVSQHLKELKEIGLIHGEIDGLKINYCLCNSKIQYYKKMMDAFFENMTDIDVQCETHCK